MRRAEDSESGGWRKYFQKTHERWIWQWCRGEKAEFQKQAQAQATEIANFKAQATRKDELIALLEEEGKRKAERIAQADKLAEQLKATVHDHLGSISALKVFYALFRENAIYSFYNLQWGLCWSLKV